MILICHYDVGKDDVTEVNFVPVAMLFVLVDDRDNDDCSVAWKCHNHNAVDNYYIENHMAVDIAAAAAAEDDYDADTSSLHLACGIEIHD